MTERCGDFSDMEDCEFAATMVCQAHSGTPLWLCDTHAGRHGRYCDAKLTPIQFYKPPRVKFQQTEPRYQKR